MIARVSATESVEDMHYYAERHNEEKLIFEKESQRVLGVGIVGPGPRELIAEGVVETEAVAHAFGAQIP